MLYQPEPHSPILPVDDYSAFLLSVGRFENLPDAERYDLKRQIAFVVDRMHQLDQQNKTLMADNKFLRATQGQYLSDLCDLESDKDALQARIDELTALLEEKPMPPSIIKSEWQHYNGTD